MKSFKKKRPKFKAVFVCNFAQSVSRLQEAAAQ